MSVKYITLENLALDFIDGDRGKNYPNQSDFTDKGYCLFLSAKNVTEQGLKFIEKQFISEEKDSLLRAGRVKKNDVVMTTRGSRLGNVAYFNDELSLFNAIRINSGMIILRNKSDLINPEYLYYYLSSEMGKEQINMLRSGSAVPHFPVRDLKKIKIPKLPISIQNSVVSFFKKITHKIELNQQINQTLEAMAQALFKSWFVDFDPVIAKAEAKAEGLDQEGINRAAMEVIASQSASELDAMKAQSPEQYQTLESIARHFPDALEESELGMIPQGWEVSILSNIIDFNPRRTLKRGENAPYIGMADIPEQGHRINNYIYREMTSGPRFINGDTLLARITPCLENGKTAYVDVLNKDEIGWGSTEFIIMRPKEGIPTSIGYLIARLDSFRAIAIQSMSGTSGRQRADRKTLEELNWVIAPLTLYKLFGQFTDSYMDLVKKQSEENDSLAELRDTLLPKLLSGEIAVKS